MSVSRGNMSRRKCLDPDVTDGIRYQVQRCETLRCSDINKLWTPEVNRFSSTKCKNTGILLLG